ncbi:MAG: TonB family protein [Endomicrobium sp.]|jgi:protein TonB|nr:TonB family protein [Endomicrobium sp.]
MVKKNHFIACLILSILINAMVMFIIWINSAMHKEQKEIMEVEFLSSSPEEQEIEEPDPEEQEIEEPESEPEPEPEPKSEPEPEPEPEPKSEPEPEPPVPGKIFTVPVEEQAPEPEPDSASTDKNEVGKETKSQNEIAYEAQKFKYEAYAKQVHQKLRRYLPWLKKTFGKGYAVVKFAVHRDGTTSHVSILESSGNKNFDDEAMKLVEEETFDKLPSDYEKNVLVTAFEFRIGTNN